MSATISRRGFFRTASLATGAAIAASQLPGAIYGAETSLKKIPVDAHIWVYASRFPPDWNCTPILDEVFRELKSAGFDGVELMESVLREEDTIKRINELSEKYALAVSGTSYYGDMWNKEDHSKILDDLELVLSNLHKAGGKMIGISVGDAQRKKTEKELDAQAELLKKILPLCEKNEVEPNLHNHTYEVKDDMHDLKGTLSRVPKAKLGPDLGWLLRAGIDPAWFINNYGARMVYMHIRDLSADGKWTEAVGEGVGDFSAVAKALKKINYQGRAAIELAFDEPPKRPVPESWEKSRKYVRNVFGW